MSAMDSRADQLRVPPHSIDAEQSVLGGLLLAGDRAWWAVADVLTEADFYRADHRLIFAAIGELIASKKPIDAVTVGDWIESRGQAEQVAGGAYLIELASTTPSAANVRAYAEIVADKARLRRMIEVGAGLMNAGYAPDGRSSVELVGEAQSRIGGLLDSEPCDLEPVAPVMQRVYERLEQRSRAETAIHGLRTGITDLDGILSGLKPGGLYVLAARPKMGKEQPNSALVRVPGGWKAIGDIAVGDPICSPDGEPSQVVGVYPQGVRDVYRLTFADGRTARCGIEHLWEVRHRRWSEPKIIDTRQLSALVHKSPGRYSVRMVSGHFEAAADLPVDPWLAGFLIGDGSLTSSVGFSTGDEEIVERVRSTVGPAFAIRHYGTCDYRIVTARGQANPLRDALRALGLFGCKSPDKRIPRQYLRGDREQRMELLRGLVDADGWVEKYGCVQIATSSEGLAGDIRELVWSLGGKCSLRTKETARRPAYVLTLNLGPGQVPAWLPRKVDRLKGGRGQQQWLTVKAVEAEGTSEQCTCIKVSHPSELYVTDDYVVTHNTTLAQNIAEHCALVQGKPAAVFSFEMQPEELGDRMLASIGGISGAALRTGQLDEADWSNVTRAMQRLRGAEIYVSRPRNARVEHVVAQTRRQHARKPLGLVVIDYLQLMTVVGDNRAQGIGDITRALKLMAGEIGVPVLLLSQLNRELEKRPDKRPIVSDLRDSGSIEQDADAVIFIYRDEVYDKASRWRGSAELIVPIQRSGPPGECRVLYMPEQFRFSDLPEYWQPAAIADDKPAPARRGFGGASKARPRHGDYE